MQQPCRPSARCLPGAVSRGAFDLRDVLLPIEMQVRQVPRRAFVLVHRLLERTVEDTHVVTESDPRDSPSVRRRHDDRSDDPAPSLSTRTPVPRNAPSQVYRQKWRERSEHPCRVEAAPIARRLGERVLAVGQRLDNGSVRSIIEHLEPKGQDGKAACRSRPYIVHARDVHRYVETIIGSATKPTETRSVRLAQRQ